MWCYWNTGWLATDPVHWAATDCLQSADPALRSSGLSPHRSSPILPSLFPVGSQTAVYTATYAQSEYQLRLGTGLLVSESRHKGTNYPSLRNQVVDGERMRPGHWLALALFEFCSVFWHCWLRDRNDKWPVENLCHLSLELLCWNKRKKTEGEQANQGSPEKWR